MALDTQLAAIEAALTRALESTVAQIEHSPQASPVRLIGLALLHQAENDEHAGGRSARAEKLQAAHRALVSLPPPALDIERISQSNQGSQAALQMLLVRAQQLLEATQELLSEQDAPAASSRSNYLVSLNELVGPRPAHSYADEWVQLRTETML